MRFVVYFKMLAGVLTITSSAYTVLSNEALAETPQAASNILYAVQYGVVADGRTSNDVALEKAAAACTEVGGSLVLPSGKILLTGAAQIHLNHCAFVGAGVPAGDSSGLFGTTIELTSTTVQPFVARTSWSLTGMNFYWPNQTTGTTVYPPLLEGNMAHAFIDHVVIVNAYDGIVSSSSGDVIVTNSTMWALHDLFRLTNTGDSWVISDDRFTPGTWLTMCGYAPCREAVNAGAAVNTLFHITNGGAVNLDVEGAETFAWRTGILIDSGGLLAESIFDISWDGTGTLIDTSSGGNYAHQNTFTGFSSSCSIAVYGGKSNTPTNCFNLGANSGLTLDGFEGGGASGNFIVSAGANVYLNNSFVDGVGNIADNGDYYAIYVTANTGGTVVSVKDSEFGGNIQYPSKIHGIVTNVPIARLVVQNSSFIYYNDDITAPYANGTTMITGNWSAATTGTSSINLSGAGTATVAQNQWDAAPLAQTEGCGVGAVAHGGLAGTISAGSGANKTCSLQLPFAPAGLNTGSCVFQSSAGVVSSSVSKSNDNPPVWTIKTATDVSEQEIFYMCAGSM